ncbi:MAG: type IVB secretion system protein IcmM/DotJ [Gammaproteobacteria bacterium]|nr:type IVB secretion system protein IcmM/DotJ [Gammaproteobacteria bacterium]
MQREVWRLMIGSKRFYVGTFRFLESMLVLSLLISVLLGVGLFYTYLHMPDRRYYATNGVVPPSELTAMEEPNETSTALLVADPVIDDDEKLIPK